MELNVFAKLRSYHIIILVLLPCCYGCVADRNFDIPEVKCVNDLVANSTYGELKALFDGETVQIHQDLVIEGYVISSDVAGNFFNVLYFQNAPRHPTDGFQIEIDLRDSHLFYPVGSKIYIKVKDLYLGKSKGVFKIGGVFTSFGNVSVGRMPATTLADHLFIACGGPYSIEPTDISMTQMDASISNSLVQLRNVEIVKEELGATFALAREETERKLSNCEDEELILLNSGFADFQDQRLPEGNGTITGVLLRENNMHRLIIRNLDDIEFSQERCADFMDMFTSSQILISELADPDNKPGARFLELYNASSERLSLKGWTLRRYTNANTEVSSVLDLSDYSIGASTTFVISPNTPEFENTYGFQADMGAGSNSPADSNGDDNLELVDPFGKVVDIFGRIGEDGSGTDHEFEDGRALRIGTVTKGNTIYVFDEWEIYNDSGNSGTLGEVQNAPNDFTPGVRFP